LFFGSNVDLPSPASNTEKLEELFSQCRFGEEEKEFTAIEKLVDYQATKENILNGILEVFGDADEDDVSYFYYMGHGGVNNGIPVITPTETKFTLETEITVHELEEHLTMIPGTKVIFLETCHAGNFIDKGIDIIFEAFTDSSLDLLNKEGYQVLASSKGSEYSYDSANGSYFCRGLINGCNDLRADTNEDEIVDMSELHKYTKQWVNNHRCKCQTVQIWPEGSSFPVYEE